MTVHHTASETVLDRILERTVSDLTIRKRTVPDAALRKLIAVQPSPVSLKQALRGQRVAVIAEIKRASPSRGVFPLKVEPAEVAAAYLAGGAAALSVLTDAPFFAGSLADLDVVARVARARTSAAPVLRKDFLVDPYQVLEARAHGADAVLLIVAAVPGHTLRHLFSLVQEHGLEALVEVHDEAELERAIEIGASTIGINNRDLRTFEVDLGVTERLAPRCPSDVTIVAESGVFSAADVARLGRAGAHAVLVGEGLIVQQDRAAAVRSLLMAS